MLMHQSLSGIAPLYLAEDCRLVADVRERRLNMRRDTDTQHLRRQSVRSCRPRTMEQSSSHLKDADLSYSEFRRSLKTFLFG